MPGQEYGLAIAEILFGVASPSGRLPLTLPNIDNEEEFTKAQFPGIDGHSVYSEGLLIGYRWYDHHKIKPRYPFGHGLSYSAFEYSALQINEYVNTSSFPPAITVNVSFTISNVGNRTADDVPQIYLSYPLSCGEPPKVLRAFQKVKALKPGGDKRLVVTLSDRDFSVWDVATHAWALCHGTFGVVLAASSGDERIRGVARI